MKRSILSTILYRTQKPSQLLGAIIGSLLGFFLVIAAAQLFADFKSMVTSSEQAIGSQFLVVNKQVSVLNSFKLGKSTFNKNEVEQLKSLPLRLCQSQMDKLARQCAPNCF